MVELSVVMPAYNEADNLPDALDDIVRHVLGPVPEAEVIVVNDGSTDASEEVLAGLSSAEPRIKVITQPNAGHGAAVMTGLGAFNGQAVLLLDSDREIVLEDFADHWRMFNEQSLDAILGVRIARESPWHRVIVTTSMRVLIRVLFGVRLKDGNAPYKLIGRAAFETIRPMMHGDIQIPSVAAAVALMRTSKNRVREVDVGFVARRAGQTTLKIRKLSRLCAKATLDLFNLRRALRG